MGHQRNTLLSSDEGINKAYNPDHIKNNSLVTTEDKFVCYAQVIMTIRDQGGKLVIGIYRIYKKYDSNIIGLHRNYLLPDEGSNKVSKPELDMASKPYIKIIKCAKYILNDPLNQYQHTSSNFLCKYYGTPTTLTNDRK